MQKTDHLGRPIKIKPQPLLPSFAPKEAIDFAKKLQSFTKRRFCVGGGCGEYYQIPVFIIDNVANSQLIIHTIKSSNMNFGQALEEVKKGKSMRLPQWQPDVKIKAQYPDEHSKMTAPYLYVESRFGNVPWKETMIELFAENWEVVE